jgi:hypothetical protein
MHSRWQKWPRVRNAGETAYATTTIQQLATLVGQAFSLPEFLPPAASRERVR